MQNRPVAMTPFPTPDDPTDMQIIKVPVNAVVVGERFRVDYGDMDELCTSIKQHGLLQPIVVDSGLRLVAGGRRLEACKRLLLDTVPCSVRIDATDDAVLRELELVENLQRFPFAWQEELRLIAEIHRLKTGINLNNGKKWLISQTASLFDKSTSSISKDLALAEALIKYPELEKCENKYGAAVALKDISMRVALQGMGKKAPTAEGEAISPERAEHIAKIMGISPDALTPLVAVKKELLDPKRAAEADAILAAKTDAEAGKTWEDGWRPRVQVVEFGTQRMILGDSIKAMLSPEEAGRYNLVHADPPYGIGLDKHKARHGHEGQVGFDDTAEWYTENIQAIADGTFACAADNSWLVFWLGITNYEITMAALTAAGWDMNPVPAYWIKPNGYNHNPNTSLTSQVEVFLTGSKGSKAVINVAGRSNAFIFKHARQKVHTTQKPVALLEELLKVFTLGPRSKICDPFMGSGSMAIASMRQRMVYKGWEIKQENHAQAQLFYKDYFIRGITDE